MMYFLKTTWKWAVSRRDSRLSTTQTLPISTLHVFTSEMNSLCTSSTKDVSFIRFKVIKLHSFTLIVNILSKELTANRCQRSKEEHATPTI